MLLATSAASLTKATSSSSSGSHLAATCCRLAPGACSCSHITHGPPYSFLLPPNTHTRSLPAAFSHTTLSRPLLIVRVQFKKV